MRKRAQRDDSQPSPLADALAEVAGAAIVLDPELRVAASTSLAETLLGFPVPAGESAAKLLCGESVKRPLAEALAAGRPVEALIPRPKSSGDALVRVRSLPLGDAARRSGWLLLLLTRQTGQSASCADPTPAHQQQWQCCRCCCRHCWPYASPGQDPPPPPPLLLLPGG